MCGIVGVVSSAPSQSAKDREKFFRTALIVDQVRGFHSTGFFKVQRPYSNRPDDHGSVFTMKKAFNANDFMELKAVDSSLSSLVSTDILIGHNRWATMGGITHATAHPFTHGAVTLVHNGTLHWYDDLPGGKDFDIDSEAIAYALSSVEPDKATTILEKLDGAYALVWYDARIGKVRAARNDERPLHFCHSADNKDLLIASEAGMLQWLADRHSFKPKEVWQLKEGVMITLDRDDLTEYEIQEFEIYDDGYAGYRTRYPQWNEYIKKDTKKEGDTKKPTGVPADDLKQFGLKVGGEVCFDPSEFEFYAGENQNPEAPVRFGKLVGVACTPSGRHIFTQIDGLKFDEWGDAIGYSVVGKVVNIIERSPDKWELRLKDPKYIEEIEEEEETDAGFRDLEASETFEDVNEDEEEGVEEPYRYGPFGSIISDERWLELIGNGCGMCGGDINEDEDDLTGWDSNGDPICKHCVTQNSWEYTTPKGI